MQTSYPKTPPPVKAGYTIRMHGRVIRMRACHLEVLNFLRKLCAPRKLA